MFIVVYSMNMRRHDEEMTQNRQCALHDRCKWCTESRSNSLSLHKWWRWNGNFDMRFMHACRNIATNAHIAIAHTKAKASIWLKWNVILMCAIDIGLVQRSIVDRICKIRNQHTHTQSQKVLLCCVNCNYGKRLHEAAPNIYHIYS